MKLLAVLALLLSAGSAGAATAYVSDELVLGVYAEQNGQGQRLATLHSGARLETLGVDGEFTKVRLPDATLGWVKSTYLTTREPATVRAKQLEEELALSRATTPALAEAAARSEVEQLKRELADKQSQLDAAGVSRAAAMPPGRAPQQGVGTPAGASERIWAQGERPWIWVLAALALLALPAGGFWLGYATLARRVMHKFGGIKVY